MSTWKKKEPAVGTIPTRKYSGSVVTNDMSTTHGSSMTACAMA